ncbi:hypothetical protein EWM64_g7199 [Hericium alpestre]|uniref:BRCT domain-containing protein n=1 Tax=Hericium alpestre TaxID=135208 RepID=A0A4Y9ZRZ7_9AGAM|nr:hypothetical protein EWM64_g7199 [Hericium alpestre]
MHAALQGQHVRLQDEHARLQNEHRALQERYAELEQGYRGLVRFGQGQGQEEEELRAQFVADKNKEVAARHVAERRLVELQDRMEEIRQSCKCGRKAKKPTAMIDLTSAEEVLEEESKFNVRSLSVNDLRRGREEDQHDREGQRKKRRRLSEVAEAGASESQSAPPTASTGGGDCVYSTPLSAEADSSTAPAAAQTETSDQQLDLQMDDSQNLSMDVSPSATLVQDQTPPALEDKGGEDEKDEDEILSGDSSPQRSPGHSGNAAVGKIGMQHIDLVYETRGDQMYCRMCFARKQADPSASVVEFPTSAPWTDLAGHCEKDHAVACAALAKMSASHGMPPPKAAKTPAKNGGKDIRTFFGGGSGSGSTSKAATPSAPSSTVRISIFASLLASQAIDQKPLARRETITIRDSDSEDEDTPVNTARDSKKARPAAANSKRKKAVLLSSDEDDDDDDEIAPPPAKKAAVATSAKASAPTPKAKPKPKAEAKPAKSRASMSASKSAQSKKKAVRADDYDDDDDFEVNEVDDSDDDDFMVVDDEDEPPKKKKPAKAAAKAAPRKSTAKKDTTKSKTSAKSEPKARTDVEEVEEKAKKFNWAVARAAKAAGPSAPGSKAIPENADPDCLAGLAFVFTGELSSFSREEAVDLAKRFGGRVVGQPSSKTSFVVLGEGAGPAKLAAIKKHNLATLSEDEFLELIATRKGPGTGEGLDAKTKKKMEKEMQAIRDSAKDMEIREKAEAAKAGFGKPGSRKAVDRSAQLWTDKYAPQTLKEICGNKGQVEKLQTWLHDWSNSLKSGFKKPGKNGMNVFRAVLISGPPGIGKTTAAHLVAKLEGFTPIELNASDARSKKLVESSTNIANTSLDGWMGGGETTNVAGVTITDKSCLIMDEVDGMSAGDRGGIGALCALIKKTKIPIICIANDRSAVKMKPLAACTFNLTFRRPEASSIRSRILSIAYKEKMKIPANVIDQLVTGVQSDIRQVLNMLSTWRLQSDTMDFDQSKELAKMNEKYSTMTPFNITQKILGPYLFSRTSRETLGDKMELYFQDYSFVPLFIQENYLKTKPARVGDGRDPLDTLKHLELMDQAASSISDGDLVDAMIHGPEQHWTLMPTHAVLSTVRPASFLYGAGSGYGGPNAMSFPQWLGQNSKQTKLSRQLGEIQIRMRLKVSGDKAEIRQSYVPALFPYIVQPMMEGSSAVDDVIERMDQYYLTREDLDTVMELGVDDRNIDVVSKKIASATKSALTRKYNAQDHPIPFHKAQDLGKAPKKLAAGPAPDLEEAFDVEEDVGDEPENDKKKRSDSDAIEDDSLIQQGGGKKKTAAKSGAKGKASSSRARK